jgi:hypothetical protein
MKHVKIREHVFEEKIMKLFKNFYPALVLILAISLNGYAQKDESGDGRNGPDLNGTANPRGSDVLLKRSDLFKNACSCLKDLYANLYSQVVQKDIDSMSDLSCSFKEFGGSSSTILKDNLPSDRRLAIKLIRKDQGETLWTIGGTTETTYSSLDVMYFPTGEPDYFAIRNLPQLSYQTKIDVLDTDSLGKIKKIEYSVSNINLREDYRGVIENTPPLHRIYPNGELGTSANLMYEGIFSLTEFHSIETDVVVNLKRYRQCLLNVK